MAGILPDSGVAFSQAASGALANVNLVEGCDALWYADRCGVRIDPSAMNSMISEIINAVNSTGAAYDCQRTDNLKDVISPSMCALPVTTATLPLTDTLSGCFSGVAGRSTIQNIYDSTFCALPQTATPLGTDTLVGCIGGVAGSVPISSLSTSLCDLPLVGPVATDTIAGCFGGAPGRINIADLCALCTTDTGTPWPGVYTGDDPRHLDFPIGHTVIIDTQTAYYGPNFDLTPAVTNIGAAVYAPSTAPGTTPLLGTWRTRGSQQITDSGGGQHTVVMVQRIA